MSVTTTENPATLSDTLRDYEIHLTGAEDLPSSHRWVPLTDHAAPTVDNPPDWYNEHRGVPHYRPINTTMDVSQRPWGSNPIETGFVLTMFTGVWIQAMASWTWRKTIGRYNTTMFRWKVGGEF